MVVGGCWWGDGGGGMGVGDAGGGIRVGIGGKGDDDDTNRNKKLLNFRYSGPIVEGTLPQMLIFSSDFGIDTLEQADIIGVDGTFQTCPPPFAQLFIVQEWEAHYNGLFTFLKFTCLPFKKVN